MGIAERCRLRPRSALEIIPEAHSWPFYVVIDRSLTSDLETSTDRSGLILITRSLPRSFPTARFFAATLPTETSPVALPPAAPLACNVCCHELLHREGSCPDLRRCKQLCRGLFQPTLAHGSIVRCSVPRRRKIPHSGTNAIACAVAINPSGAFSARRDYPTNTHSFCRNMTRQKIGDLRSPILLSFIAPRSEPSRGFALSVGRVRRNRHGRWGFAPKNVLRRRGAP